MSSVQNETNLGIFQTLLETGPSTAVVSNSAQRGANSNLSMVSCSNHHSPSSLLAKGGRYCRRHA